MATNVLDQILGRLSGDAASRMSENIGASQGPTQDALGAAVPLLLAALQRNANRPGGAESLAGALDRDHDGSVLDDLGGFLGAPERGNGKGILGHVLGERRSTVEQGLARTTGLDRSQVGSLLEMAAPLVLAALGREKRERNLDAGSLADLLGREKQEVSRREPQAADLLTSLLDEDGDGSALDDIAGKLGGGLLGKFLGGR